ncbi:hypothetical protein L1887_61824 [Cichorium endivia]|nr:hypothetical protein L1887_61824 [Cichorium endivia]
MRTLDFVLPRFTPLHRTRTSNAKQKRETQIHSRIPIQHAQQGTATTSLHASGYQAPHTAAWAPSIIGFAQVVQARSTRSRLVSPAEQRGVAHVELKATLPVRVLATVPRTCPAVVQCRLSQTAGRHHRGPGTAAPVVAAAVAAAVAVAVLLDEVCALAALASLCTRAPRWLSTARPASSPYLRRASSASSLSSSSLSSPSGLPPPARLRAPSSSMRVHGVRHVEGLLEAVDARRHHGVARRVARLHRRQQRRVERHLGRLGERNVGRVEVRDGGP